MISWLTSVLEQPLSLSLLVGGLVLGLLLSVLTSGRKPSLPAGPRGLPLLGYLPFLSTKEPHLQLDRMRKKYGDVFGMYLGRTYTLFLCDLDSTKEAFNMDEFSGRPPGFFEFSKDLPHMASQSGEPWKESRRLMVKSLRRVITGSNELQEISRTHIAVALDELETKATHSEGGVVNVRSALETASTGITFNIVCGKYFPPDHNVFKIINSYLQFFAQNGTAISPDTFFPWLRPIFMKIIMNSDTKKIMQDMEQLVWSEIESHEEHPPDEPQDFLDSILLERKKSPHISRAEINGNAQVLLFGGADTVRGTVEWFVLCMAEFPEVQEKVFHEVNEVLGASGEPNYNQRHQMPYTEAAILESMRFRPIVPVNPVHSTTVDVKFRGYEIPKGAVVISCLWSIHNDPKHWSSPSDFRPEHFLTSDGKVYIPDAFVAFAPGKRYCIGDKMALVEVFLFSVSLLQRFQILPPDGGVRTEGNLRINMEAMYPIVKLRPRHA